MNNTFHSEIVDGSQLRNYLTPFGPTLVEKNEMNRIWNSTQPVETLPDKEINSLLKTLNLEVSLDADIFLSLKDSK